MPTTHIALYSITNYKSLCAVICALKKIEPALTDVVLPSDLWGDLRDEVGFEAIEYIDGVRIWHGTPAPKYYANGERCR